MTVVLAAHSVPAARAAGGRGERNTAAAMTTSMPATRKAFRDIAPPFLCEPRIVRAEPGAPGAPGGNLVPTLGQPAGPCQGWVKTASATVSGVSSTGK